MSEPDQLHPLQTPPPRVGRFVSGLVVVVSLFVLFAAVIGAWGIEIPFLLGFGWISFLSRTVPRITFNGSLIGMSLVCVVGVLGLGHGFLRWFTSHAAAASGRSWSWSWKWTWCGVSMVAVALLVGMAAGGIVHQVGWMTSTPGPWFEQRGQRVYERVQMKELCLAVQQTIAEAHGDIAEARRQLRQTHWGYQPTRAGALPPLEKFCCLLIREDSGQITGAILFPRDRSEGETARSLFYWFEGDHDFWPVTKLPALVRKHEGQLLAL
jgi:hypothetical protein